MYSVFRKSPIFSFLQRFERNQSFAFFFFFYFEDIFSIRMFWNILHSDVQAEYLVYPVINQGYQNMSFLFEMRKLEIN